MDYYAITFVLQIRFKDHEDLQSPQMELGPTRASIWTPLVVSASILYRNILLGTT
jgi:hypothetical protein